MAATACSWFGGSMTRLQLHHDGWLAVAVHGDA